MIRLAFAEIRALQQFGPRWLVRHPLSKVIALQTVPRTHGGNMPHLYTASLKLPSAARPSNPLTPDLLAEGSVVLDRTLGQRGEIARRVRPALHDS